MTAEGSEVGDAKGTLGTGDTGAGLTCGTLGTEGTGDGDSMGTWAKGGNDGMTGPGDAAALDKGVAP